MVTATIVTLVVIEIGLQIAAVAAPSLLSRAGDISDSSTITILCVGDSHTYGAPLPEADAYPAQLQRMLDERLPQWSFEVINLGFPGVNSTFVANRLETQLSQIRPDIVMVTAGTNNLWNKLGEDEDKQGTSAFRQVLLKIKLYRLLTIAFAVHEKDRYDDAEGQGRRWFTDERRAEDGIKIVAEYRRKVEGKVDKQYLGVLRGDMRRIKGMTDDMGVPPDLVQLPVAQRGSGHPGNRSPGRPAEDPRRARRTRLRASQEGRPRIQRPLHLGNGRTPERPDVPLRRRIHDPLRRNRRPRVAKETARGQRRAEGGRRVAGTMQRRRTG